MRSFLHLPATSKDAYISFRDIFVNDLLRLLSLLIMFPLVYGIGWLIGSAGPGQYPLYYYAQIFLMENSLVELIMVAAACVIAVGVKSPVRFWSTSIVAILVSLLDTPNFL